VALKAIIPLMPARELVITIFFLFFTVLLFAQKKSATVSGKVLDENENPLPKVSITILGQSKGVITTDSGRFSIRVPVDKAFALVFSYTGYTTEQRNFYLNDKEEEHVVIKMEKGGKVLQEVVVSDQRERKEVGLVRINPKNAIVIPSATGGVESLIKVVVGSNNELTSQYSVRGGNFDENLIYVNDFEVFRPYLVRSGQQEGLSFINPELTGKVSFYTGGFQAHYGDKMSSVLDVQYKKPKSFGGSAYISLLEQGFHLEGTSGNNKFTYLVGLRNRSNRSLLSSQEVKGSYIPSSTDLQAVFTYQVSRKWQFELLGNISRTKFTMIPETSQLTTSVFSPFFSANLGLDIFFDGREEDRYRTNMFGLSAIQQINRKLKFKWQISRYEDDEQENYDIEGAYLFGERDFDRSHSTFGTVVNPLGAGDYQTFGRNHLNIQDYDIAHKGSYDAGRHFFQWGVDVEKTLIQDKLNNWEAQDSAGYNLPYNPASITLSKYIKSAADLDINKFSGYIQDNIALNDSFGLTMQAGVRFNYNALNKQFLVSPRLQFSWNPTWNPRLVLKLAAGAYHQPPFYREMRRYDGSVNESVLAQKSWQFVAGADYQFKAWERPFRLSTEAYYKLMRDVVPYDLNNVSIQYYGENSAKAYATGIEMRLFGELVKDAESFVSLGIMRTRENLDNDHYYNYYNSSGELINSKTDDQVAVDSARVDVGWLRRPTDRLITFGLFFQDYLSTNKNFKVHLNFIYGSNMPYNVPNSVKYRNALIIEPYIRADIGFSALLLDSEKMRRGSHSPFRSFESIWASFEVFNLFDRANTISYFFVKDFSNTIFAIPQRLTPRLVNFKIVARF